MNRLSRAAVRHARALAAFGAAAGRPAARHPAAALAAMLAAATVTALAAPSAARPAAAPGAEDMLTAGGGVAITLTSAGTGGAGGTLPSGYPRIAENGRYAAFQSDAALKATASVPQTPAPRTAVPPDQGVPSSPAVSRVYVRDEVGKTTTLVSDAKAGDAVAPDISADGKLVSYELGSGGAYNVYVTDRQATGKGAFDTPANLRVRQVTGTSSDLPDERIPACPAVPAAATPQTVPCGPRISADGTTLVYAARQTPASPALRATWTGENGQPVNPPVNLSGNLLDFNPSGPQNQYGYGLSLQSIQQETVTYTVAGASPVTFSDRSVAVTSPFTVQGTNCTGTLTPGSSCPPFTIQGTTCTGTLDPGGSCQVTVNFSGYFCALGTGPVLVTGSLTTDATTPAGQSTTELQAYCGYTYTEAYRPRQRPGAGGAPVPDGAVLADAVGPDRIPARAGGREHLLARTSRDQAQPPACSAPSGSLLSSVPFARAPAASGDNQGNSLVSLGDVNLGRPRVVWATVTNPSSYVSDFAFRGSGCGIQLIDPGSRAVAGQPAPCQNGTGITLLGAPSYPASCTAYFFVDPSAVGIGTESAVFGLPSLFPSPETRYIAVSGIRSLVIARRDPTGKGNFAASPSVVVSVDGSGRQIPAAGQPSVSSTGRYVAFTAPVPAGQPGAQPGSGTEVWLHDTDATGNRTYKPGSTVIVSCLPGAGACRPAPSADSPSLSGDGQTVAFTAGNQVEVRDIHAGRTVVASAGPSGTPGNGPSYAPALSSDASTVAYVSEATNLTGIPRSSPPGTPSLYVRQLLPGSGGNELIEPTATAARGASGAGGSGLPAIDAHGRLVAFQSADRLAASAASGVENVYTAERFPHLTATPATITFGSLLLPGTSPGSHKARTVTIKLGNAGPGPATVTGVHVTGSFGLGAQTCLGEVLHEGAGCTATVSFTPVRPGHFTGSLVVTTTDDGEPPASFPVTATAAVTAPALTLSPPVDLPGQVTQVHGTGFPAATAITLTWSPGLGTATVKSDSAGRFTAAMLIFPDDVVGPRELAAKADGKALATAPFLVDPPPAEPPFTQSPGVPPSARPASGSQPTPTP